MPLHSKRWPSFVSYAFNGFVVGIYEPAIQRSLREAVHVYGIAVILRGDVAAVGLQIQSWLVLAAVTKL